MSPHRWVDIAMVFQGAMNAFNPVKTIGEQIVEPMELHGTASGRQARRQVGELLERVGIPAARAASYPAPVLGRDAAAGRDRDGARLQAEGPPRRRADDCARRDGAGADPPAPRRARGRLRPRARPRHSRPPDRRPGLRASRGHVRGRDRRGRRRRTRSTTTRAIPTRGSCSRPLPISTGRTRSSPSRAPRRGSTGSSPAARSRCAVTARSSPAPKVKPRLVATGRITWPRAT